ncbi:hypothetical protein CROQUDRAFT_649950 [Cronartium quercuum f. sp. fusiforme G11]|uniref:Rab-GAP TBC domain-containing protein n=1 Tax=Cronartium quercuum f. sp. fusiforme G11 TaxID=708437 RepID=A0A9P6NY75_9BASI|nr:hypothetical protein CROQUDRAFT_649950 [Cronartium quercuum f. sp. fusiforme G11]
MECYTPDWSVPSIPEASGVSNSNLGYIVERDEDDYPTPNANQHNFNRNQTQNLTDSNLNITGSINHSDLDEVLIPDPVFQAAFATLPETYNYQNDFNHHHSTIPNHDLNLPIESFQTLGFNENRQFESICLSNLSSRTNFSTSNQNSNSNLSETESDRTNSIDSNRQSDLNSNNNQAEDVESNSSDFKLKQQQQQEQRTRSSNPSPTNPQSTFHSNTQTHYSNSSEMTSTSTNLPSPNHSQSPPPPPPARAHSAPLSTMSAPPKPADKSKAGKKAVEAIQGGGGLGTKGKKANVLQKVLSRTRPKDLPPKPQEEDERHLREYKEMMTISIEMQKRKEAQISEQRLAREQLLTSYQPAWEKDVLPNWKSVMRDDALGKSLRNMWWLGTMPPRHRGRLWHQCIGNAGAVGRSAFLKSVALAKSLMNSTPSRFPPEVIKAIDSDLSITLPKLKLFQEGKPMHTDLRQILLAWSVFWRERPFYPKGSSFVAALFLINMTPQDAFLSLVNISRKSCLSYFYNNKINEIESFYRIFDTLLADTMPKVYRNFQERRIKPSLYLKPWITTVYIGYLPIELATRVMDVFVLEGDSFLFRLALALLKTLEARLFNPDPIELEAIFNGTDKGARSIVIRNTLSIFGQRTLDEVTADEAYEEMGCIESNVFEKINEQNWNEALWERLVSRELPD